MQYLSEASAEDCINVHMQEFANYTISHKLSSLVDGLLLVHRRILWTMKDVDVFNKCSTVAGNVIKLHPHSPTAVEESIFQLSQESNNVLPLIDANGNNGRYFADTHASGRYVEMNMSQFARDVYFTRTNLNNLHYIPSETGDGGMEPKYLVPCIPMALLMGTFGIGLGYRCHITPMGLNEVCDAVMKYAERYAKHLPNKDNEFAKYFLPDFPVNCRLLNANALIKEYAKGNYDIAPVTEGLMTIASDMIALHTIPYGISFGKLNEKLGSMIVGKNNLIADNFSKINNSSVGKILGNLKLTLRRGVSPFEVLDELKKLIRFQSAWHPQMYFATAEDTLYHATPMNLLTYWFNERLKIVYADLKQTQKRLISDLRKNEALLIIVDHTDTVLNLFKQAAEPRDTIKPLMNLFGLSEFQAAYIADLKLTQITKQGKQVLQKEHDDLTQKITSLRDKYNNVSSLVYDDAAWIKKNYGKKAIRRTVIPKYHGAVIVPNGALFCESFEELERNLNSFDNARCVYLENSKYLYVIKGGQVIDVNNSDELASQATQLDDLVVSNKRLTRTIGYNGKNACWVNALCTTNAKTCVLVGNTITAISSSGIVTQMDVAELEQRRNISMEGNRFDALHISAVCEPIMYAVYANTSSPNEVRITKLDFMTKKKNKLILIPIGETKIIGLIGKDDPLVCTLDESYMYHCATRHLFIPNINNIIGNNEAIQIFVSKKVTSNGRKLVPYQKSCIFTIV